MTESAEQPESALPERVQVDWATSRSLPPGAAAQLWDVLPPLGNPQERGPAFCQVHSITPDVLQAALRVSGFLVDHAAGVDLTRHQFERILDELPGADHPLRTVLLEGFERAKQETRENFARRALLAHGKVLTGMEWRVDVVRASNLGLGFEIPAVVLTLRHQEGGRDDATTLTTSLAGFQNLANTVRQIEKLLDAQAPGSGSLEPPAAC